MKSIFNLFIISVFSFSNLFSSHIQIDNSELFPVVVNKVFMDQSSDINRDCSDCTYDFTAYGSECCDSAWDTFGLDCAALEANYNWDCSGCACPGDGDYSGCTDESALTEFHKILPLESSLLPHKDF